MFKSLFITLALILTNSIFGQSVNLILEVNGKVINSGFANIYLCFGDGKNAKKFYVDYQPGDLVLNEEVLSIIKSDTINKFFLHLDYYNYEYKGNEQGIANFDIELTRNLIEERYLIADIYDFRNKKYKRQYQYLTKDNYLVQFTFRDSSWKKGIYIPMK
jgi:hypothetical protein